MEQNKIVRLPNRYERKKRVDASKGELRCEVSERWIKFPEASSKHFDMDYLALDVMTLGANEKEIKLCEIIVDRDLLETILRELPRKTYPQT
ncbi:hypothetical protein EAY39_23180 [Vibrio anguillarum]|uniref:hypothetical protein n=1 Tax=Vibrio anguillarum TaxID=55601 RepID=UPI0018C344C4|nr:hypothetical protein [Vibrio anguillarum]MBF4343590.1 hypothetical protein [Vibrio anguillarum]